MARKKSFFQRARELEKEAVKYIEDNVKEILEVNAEEDGEEVRVAFYDHHSGETYTLEVDEIVPENEDKGMHISGWCDDTCSNQDVYPIDWGDNTAVIIADIVLARKRKK